VNNHYKPVTQRMIETILSTPGDSSSRLRQAVAARAAALGGYVQDSTQESVPPELSIYVDKVAQHAYKVTDTDIERLRDVGYTEDAIFEITLSAALGAGIGRLESGLRALKGAE
jgi:alkylhydroperoxidase family enzyme